MPSATILSPRTGDTVGTTVHISVAYANFTVATNLKCKIHTAADTAESVTGAGLHTGTATTTTTPELQRVLVFTDEHGDLHEQPDVKVTSGPTPVQVEDVVTDEPGVKGAGGPAKKKLKKVKGQVPNGSTATRVVCTVYRIDARDGSQSTAAGPTEGPVAGNRKWDVNFDLELDDEDYIQYVVRACAFNGATPLGCESKPVRKK